MSLRLEMSVSITWTCPECERELDGTEPYEYHRNRLPVVTCPDCGHKFATSSDLYDPVEGLMSGQVHPAEEE